MVLSPGFAFRAPELGKGTPAAPRSRATLGRVLLDVFGWEAARLAVSIVSTRSPMRPRPGRCGGR